MRYLYSLFVLVLFVGLYSCETTQEEKGVPLSPANWNDTTAIGKLINDYYKDSVFKVGKIAMEIKDPSLNKSNPYLYMELQKVLRPKLKQTSATTAYMPVLMFELRDSAIVDFQIEWQQLNPNDSAGTFVVVDKFVQKFGTQPRYEWVKEDEFWIRKNVEAPAQDEASE